MTTTRTPNRENTLTVDQQIGMAVDAALWRAGWTQSRLARAAEIDQTTVSRKLAGRRPFLGRELVQIAGLLGIEVAELVQTQENPHPAGPNGGATGVHTHE